MCCEASGYTSELRQFYCCIARQFTSNSSCKVCFLGGSWNLASIFSVLRWAPLCLLLAHLDKKSASDLGKVRRRNVSPFPWHSPFPHSSVTVQWLYLPRSLSTVSLGKQNCRFSVRISVGVTTILVRPERRVFRDHGASRAEAGTSLEHLSWLVTLSCCRLRLKTWKQRTYPVPFFSSRSYFWSLSSAFKYWGFLLLFLCILSRMYSF